MYTPRPMCDGYDVSTEVGVIHYASMPTEADIASTIAAIKDAPEPEPFVDQREVLIESLTAEVEVLRVEKVALVAEKAVLLREKTTLEEAVSLKDAELADLKAVPIDEKPVDEKPIGEEPIGKVG